MAKNADFRPIRRYVSEIIDDKHIYNGRILGNRIRVHKIGTSFDDFE